MAEITVDEETLDAMQIYGGAFVVLLGRLYRVADADNQQTLRHAFADYFHEYARIAQDVRRSP